MIYSPTSVASTGTRIRFAIRQVENMLKSVVISTFLHKAPILKFVLGKYLAAVQMYQNLNSVDHCTNHEQWYGIEIA